MPRSIPSARPRSAGAGAVPDARTGTPASTGRETRCCTVPDPQPGPPRRANSLTTPGSAASALAPRASLDRLPRRVQSTAALAPARAPSTGDAMATRMQLLQDFRQARDRPISKEHAIAAVKLRGAAEARYDKREVSKLRPSLVKRVETRSVEFKGLLAMPPDDAIAWLADHPGEGSRTLLGDLAEAHLLQSFGIDHEKFRRGIRKAAMWEQLHSTAGRVVTLAGSGVAFGTSFIPEHGVQLAVEHGKKAARFIGHQLPNNLVNPGLTGWLRAKTDVIETYRRVGGAPVVAASIDKSPHMGEVRDGIASAEKALAAATRRFRDAQDPHAELPSLVAAFEKLSQAANGDYKSRMAFNKLSGYSKAWGGVVNLFANAGTLASISGHPHVGLGFAAAAIPLQWLAGVGDEHTKHDFNHRANTKWALRQVLAEEARHLSVEELRPEHIDAKRVQALFALLPQMQIAGVREVYENRLGELLKETSRLETRIQALKDAEADPPRKLVKQRPAGVGGVGGEGGEGGDRPPKWAALDKRRAELERAIADIKLDVDRFESGLAGRTPAANLDIEPFGSSPWRDISADGLIGKCLDSTAQLSREQRKARTNRPGEVSAQVLQRYAQTFHNPIATAAGLDLPVAEGLAIAGDGVDVTMPLATVAAAANAEETFDVRADKVRNKPVLSKRMVDDARYQADAARWVFEAGGRSVDLRNSGGYNQLVHTRAQRLGRVAAEVPRALFTGPVGAYRLVGARRQRTAAKATMQEAVQALRDVGLPTVPGQAGSRYGDSIAALEQAFLGFQVVRDIVGAPADAARPVGVTAGAPVSIPRR